MIHVQAVSTSGDPAEPITIPTSQRIDQAQRLDRLAPLIHQLLTWNLVDRSESGEFRLRDDVQQRLQEFAAVPTPVTAQVYLGRKCEVCGLVRATRMVEGARICGPCSHPAAATPSSTEAGPDRPGHQGLRARWHRKAS